MKYLELSLTDFELYHLSGDTDFIEHLESNISAFKKLYYDQGEDFWLRHLLNLREYLYILIRAKFEHEDGLCLHWIINPLEKIFIQMHNLIIVKGFDAIKKSFKSLKRNVKKTNLDVIPYLTHKEKWQLITSCSVKMAYKSLFGFNIENSKSTTIKIYFAVDLYKYFCKTVSVLLKRYANAVSSNNDKQYWKPFSYWSKKGYEAELFENYLARVYKENLSKKVSLLNAYQIFHCKYMHKCCERFIKQCGLKIMEGNGDFYKQKVYQTCNKHNSCFLRFVHDQNCKNPHFCALKKACTLSCDTEVYEKNLEAIKDESYWKSHIVVTHPNPDNSNRRDVNTLTETHDCIKKTEHYPTHTVNYDFDEENDSTLWRELPPDFANFAKQLERKEKTKSRLRDKLSKKSRSSSRDECVFHSTDMLTPFSDFNFRVSMLYHAKNLFRDELSDELLCRLFKDKVGKSDTPLIDIFEGRYEINDLCSKKLLSVSVGSNVPYNFHFLSSAKLMHIHKRLELKFDTPVLDVSNNYKAKNFDNNSSVSNNSTEETFVCNPSIKKKGKHKRSKGADLDTANCKISSNGSEISVPAENMSYNSEIVNKSMKAKENYPEQIAVQVKSETDAVVSSVDISGKINYNDKRTEIKENSPKQIKASALEIEPKTKNKNCAKNSEEINVKVNSKFTEIKENSSKQIKALALEIKPETENKNCANNSEESDVKVNYKFTGAIKNCSEQVVTQIESETDIIMRENLMDNSGKMNNSNRLNGIKENSSKKIKALALEIEPQTEDKSCTKNSEESNMNVNTNFTDAAENYCEQIATQIESETDIIINENSVDNSEEINNNNKHIEIKENSSKEIKALALKIKPKRDVIINTNCAKNYKDSGMKVNSELTETTKNSSKITLATLQFDHKVDATVNENSKDNICETDAKGALSKSPKASEISSKQMETLAMQIEPKEDVKICKKDVDEEVKRHFKKFVDAKDYSHKQLENFVTKVGEIINAAANKSLEDEFEERDSAAREYILRHAKAWAMRFPKAVTMVRENLSDDAEKMDTENIPVLGESEINGFLPNVESELGASNVDTKRPKIKNEKADHNSTANFDQKITSYIHYLTNEFADCPYLIKDFTESAKAAIEIMLIARRENMTQNGYSRVNEKPPRICAYCGKLEPSRHAFKKCKLCKDENVRYPCYYCSRTCQIKDWKENHQNDHQDTEIV